MRVLYVEGIAGHGGPESCAGAREGGGEALTGVHAGRVSSREKLKVQGADAVETGGRQHGTVRHGEHRPDPAWSETSRTHASHLQREPGYPLAGHLGKSDPCGPHRKGSTRNPMMHGQGKSDLSIVPSKSSNKAASAATETMEGGAGPRAMRSGAARARRRAGKAYPWRWAAYEKLQDGISEFGSRHSCTM